MKKRAYANTKVIFVFLIIGIFLGALVGSYIKKDNSSLVASLQSENAGLKSQLENIKSKFPPSKEMSFMPGRVMKVEADSIIINSSLSMENPLEDLPKIRTLVVNS